MVFTTDLAFLIMNAPAGGSRVPLAFEVGEFSCLGLDARACDVRVFSRQACHHVARLVCSGRIGVGCPDESRR